MLSCFSRVPLFATLWTLSLLRGCSVPGFSRQEYWRELPFLSPEDLPNPRVKPGSPVLQADFLLSEALGEPLCSLGILIILSWLHLPFLEILFSGIFLHSLAIKVDAPKVYILESFFSLDLIFTSWLYFNIHTSWPHTLFQDVNIQSNASCLKIYMIQFTKISR